jgi:hypothetical protein
MPGRAGLESELAFEDRFGSLVDTEWTACEQRRLTSGFAECETVASSGTNVLRIWLEFFLFHEAHHLYTMMIRLGEAPATRHGEPNV